MSLGRSSRFCFLGLAKVKSETVLSSFASASLPPVFIMVVCCVAGILDTDIGKTLMNMEMLKFLRARSDTTLGYILSINLNVSSFCRVVR